MVNKDLLPATKEQWLQLGCTPEPTPELFSTQGDSVFSSFPV